MSVKFVSKNSNFMVVLKPGIEGSRVNGTRSVPGLYVRFQGGVVDVKEQEVIDLLREHNAFGTDFLEVKEDEADPYEYNREEIEPSHVITEMKYGHADRVLGTKKKVKISPDMKKFIEAEAVKMLPDILKSNPKILQDIILGLAADMKAKDEPKEDSNAVRQTRKKLEKVNDINADLKEGDTVDAE